MATSHELASVTSWLTAIGTVSAVVFAVGIQFFVGWQRRRLRPALKIRIGDREPYVRLEPNPANTQFTVIRVAVHNTGRSTAKNAQVHVQRAWINATAPGPKAWKEFDIDPSPLAWTSQPGQPVAIGPGLWDTAKILSLRWQDQMLYLESAGGRIEIDPTYDLGEYRIEVVAVADDIGAVASVFAFDRTAGLRVIKPRLSEAPPKRETYGGGWLQFLDAAGLSVIGQDAAIAVPTPPEGEE